MKRHWYAIRVATDAPRFIVIKFCSRKARNNFLDITPNSWGVPYEVVRKGYREELKSVMSA